MEDYIVSRSPVFLSSLQTPSITSEKPEFSNKDDSMDSGGIIEEKQEAQLLLLQFPGRPVEMPLNQANKIRRVQSRFKVASQLFQIAMPLDTRSQTYSVERGVEFGVGLAHAEDNISSGGIWPEQKKENADDMYQENMKPIEYLVLAGDRVVQGALRQVIPAQNESLSMNNNYMVARRKGLEIHLSPINSIINFKPTLNHLDGIDKYEKDMNRADANDQTDESASDADDSSAESKPQASKPPQSAKVPQQRRQAVQKKQELVDTGSSSHRRLVLRRIMEEEEWKPLEIIDKLDEFDFIKAKLISQTTDRQLFAVTGLSHDSK